MTYFTQSVLTTFGISPSASFWGNTLETYLASGILLVVLLFAFKVVQRIVLQRLAKLAERTTTDIDDTTIRIVKSIRPPFYIFLALYIAVLPLSFPSWFQHTLTASLLLLAVYQVVRAVGILIDYIGEKQRGRSGASEGGGEAAMGLIKMVSKIALWSIGLLLILSNFGIDITSLIAGLGIGGIAIAFALQAILGDLFSSFSIYLDKPFEVGDFVVIGDVSGTVERIGVKSTRLRALQGEEIVLSNADLTSSRIHNYKRMEARRIAFTIGVEYGTPPASLKKIPQIVERVISSLKNVEHDRTHFKELGVSSLDFEVVYFVQSADYRDYMNIQQDVNLGLIEAFEKEGIAFAFPTRTVHVAKA